jgi:hypothetical protein
MPEKEILMEALKGIKNEILLYGIAVAALLVASASLGLEILRELKWPLIILASVVLIAYFLGRAVPQARVKLLKKTQDKHGL